MGSNIINNVKKIIVTSKAPSPLAGVPYNQAIVYKDLVFLSGVLGIDKATNQLVQGGTACQAEKALENAGHILEAAGSAYENVLKTSVFLTDIKDFGAVNDVYKKFFCKDFPARTSFQIGKLPLDACVEIEIIAAVGKNLKTVYAKL